MIIPVRRCRLNSSIAPPLMSPQTRQFRLELGLCESAVTRKEWEVLRTTIAMALSNDGKSHSDINMTPLIEVIVDHFHHHDSEPDPCGEDRQSFTQPATAI